MRIGVMVIAGVVVMSLVACTAGVGRAQKSNGMKPKLALVELFTSEGCSSCPPADALLRSVNGKEVGGAMVVGISEHVTYWNQLGWADPFSAETYTERQNRYGQQFALDSVYTPQMVVNGSVQILGSDRGALQRALVSESAKESSTSLQIVSAKVAGENAVVTFTASGVAKGASLFAVIVDDQDESHVPRGENGGRTLTHVSVARALVRVGKLESGTGQATNVALPKGWQTDKGHQLILFAQSAKDGRVLATDVQRLER